MVFDLHKSEAKTMTIGFEFALRFGKSSATQVSPFFGSSRATKLVGCTRNVLLISQGIGRAAQRWAPGPLPLELRRGELHLGKFKRETDTSVLPSPLRSAEVNSFLLESECT